MSKFKWEIIATFMVMLIIPIGFCSFITGEIQNPFNWVPSGKVTYGLYILFFSPFAFRMFIMKD